MAMTFERLTTDQVFSCLYEWGKMTNCSQTIQNLNNYSTGDIITDSCTIPGCNYPHIFKHQSVRRREEGLLTKGRQLIRRRKTRLSCQLKLNEETSEAKISDSRFKYVLECSMQCRHNWYPKGGRNSTTCNLEQVKKIQESGVKKLTNFTTDYLECVQKP